MGGAQRNISVDLPLRESAQLTIKIGKYNERKVINQIGENLKALLQSKNKTFITIIFYQG